MWKTEPLQTNSIKEPIEIGELQPRQKPLYLALITI